jgi:hypothetical protein
MTNTDYRLLQISLAKWLNTLGYSHQAETIRYERNINNLKPAYNMIKNSLYLLNDKPTELAVVKKFDYLFSII